MSDSAKTAIFVGIAAVAALVALVAEPRPPAGEKQDMRGVPLFRDFKDPMKAASLEIIKWDEDTASLDPFKVSQDPTQGYWSIPSHSNYPADAKEQFGQASAALAGLKIIKVADRKKSSHREHGVLDPADKTLKDRTGVGTRIVLRDKTNAPLLAMVVGKQVPNREELRYVRKINLKKDTAEDPVYMVKISIDKLSTKFEDWIEKDLLKLNAWDVNQVEIRDYSFDELTGLLWRGEMSLGYDSAATPTWNMVRDVAMNDKGELTPVTLAEDEELDTSKLDDLRNALDDLKIIDVAPKPARLADALKSGADIAQIVEDQEISIQLRMMGFRPAMFEERIQLICAEGDIVCRMKDGIEYTLRFGRVAGADAGSSAGKEDEKEGEAEEPSGAGVTRYILVMAEFNPDLIPKPEYEPMPEPNGGTELTVPGSANPGPTDPGLTAPGPVETPMGTVTPDDTVPPEGTPAPLPGAEGAEGTTGAEGEAPPAPPANADPVQDPIDIEAERERIKMANRQKQDDYDKKIADGKKKAKELNDRFADWYYVISDEVYQKIHLGRDRIVKVKDPETDDTQAEPGAGGLFPDMPGSIPGVGMPDLGHGSVPTDTPPAIPQAPPLDETAPADNAPQGDGSESIDRPAPSDDPPLPDAPTPDNG